MAWNSAIVRSMADICASAALPSASRLVSASSSVSGVAADPAGNRSPSRAFPAPARCSDVVSGWSVVMCPWWPSRPQAVPCSADPALTGHLVLDGREGGRCQLEILAAVGGRYLGPYPRLADRDHRIAEADHVDALAQEQVGHPRGARSIADHHGDDRVVTGQDVKAQGGHALAEPGRVLAQAGAQIIAAFQQIQHPQRGTGHRWGYRIGEQVRPRPLAEEVNDLLAAAGVPAA